MGIIRGLIYKNYVIRRFMAGVGAIFLGTVGSEFSSFAMVAIGGAILGSEVMAAWGVVLPVKFIMTAIVRVFLDAMIIMVPRAYGKGDREKADRIFGTALIGAAIASVIAVVIAYSAMGYFFKPNCKDVKVLEAAKIFYYWSFLSVLGCSARIAIERLALVEGRQKAVLLDTAVFLVVEVVCLATLTKPLGVHGLCIADTLSSFSGTLVVLFCLIKYKTTFRPRICIKMADVVELLKLGMPKVFGRIGDSLSIGIMNLFLEAYFGTAGLAIAHFVKSSRKFLVSFADAYDNAGNMLVCAQTGERNWRGVLRSMRVMCGFTIVTGILVAIVVYFTADWFALHCGFSGDQAEVAATALRYGTAFTALYHLKDIFSSYHNCIGRVVLSSVIRFISRDYLVFLPAMFMITCLSRGYHAFFYSLLFSDAVVMGISLLASYLGRKKGTTAILNLPKDELALQELFDVGVSKLRYKNVPCYVRDEVEQWMTKMGCSRSLVVRTALVVEESRVQASYSASEIRHSDVAELLVTLSPDKESATIQLRDSLRLVDRLNPDEKPYDMEDFCSSVVLGTITSERDYNPVIGSNRTIWKVPKRTTVTKEETK